MFVSKLGKKHPPVHHPNMSEEESNVGLTQEVLVERAEEYLQIKRELADLNSQSTLLRKGLKAAEKALVNGMLVIGLEELEVGGVRLARQRGLKCED